MATVGEAIAATLIAQWTAAGGTQPDPIQYLVERPERDPNPTVADAVYVWLPLRRKFDPVDVAGTYRNVTYTIRVVCHTKTSSARQKEIENEVDRILNSGTVITGATKQTVKEINDISNRTYSVLPKYISEVIVEVFTAMEVAATAYGTGTTSTFETDELTVNTWIKGVPLIEGKAGVDFEIHAKTGRNLDLRTGATHRFQDIDGNLAASVGGTTGDGYFKGDMTIGGVLTTATQAQIDDLLMFGSANAAWVPCSALATSITALEMKTAIGYIVNPGAQDPWLGFTLHIPTTKGALKLYVTGFRAIVNAANATNFLTLVRIYGVTETAATLIEPTGNGTNRTAQGDYEYALADTDMSGYDYVVAYLIIDVADASALKLGPPLLQCYYA